MSPSGSMPLSGKRDAQRCVSHGRRLRTMTRIIGGKIDVMDSSATAALFRRF
jgi:hypothetical protein